MNQIFCVKKSKKEQKKGLKKEQNKEQKKEEEKINKEIFQLFSCTMKVFTDAEVHNIIMRLVQKLNITSEEDIKENWKKVFHQIL